MLIVKTVSCLISSLGIWSSDREAFKWSVGTTVKNAMHTSCHF
jgi:hypothetical protein